MFELIKIEIENSKNVLSHKIIRLIKKFRQLLNEVNSNVRKVIRMSVMSLEKRGSEMLQVRFLKKYESDI